MKFILEYLKHPRTVGAIAPSGKRLAKKMIAPINFKKAEVIVEYGPGTGVFTREIIKNRRKETTVILIEQNKDFVNILKELFANEENVHIINGSAEEAHVYIQKLGYETVDYVVSGLPFTSLPVDVSNQILQVTKNIIGKEGRFITFQYTLVKRGYFEKFFKIHGVYREWLNLPPAYVFEMRN